MKRQRGTNSAHHIFTMADHISALIGIVAFGLHVAHRVYEVVEIIQDGPEDIASLKHEYYDIGYLLLHLQRSDILQDRGSHPQHQDEQYISGLIERSKNALEEINKFVEKMTKKSEGGQVNVRKLKWMLRNGRCQKLRGQLACFKSSMIAAVAVCTS